MNCFNTYRFLSLAFMLLCSTHLLLAQAPQTIIITSQQCRNRPPCEPEDMFHLVSYETNTSTIECQPVNTIENVNTGVQFNDLLYFEIDPKKTNVDSLKVSIQIPHPFVSGGFTYVAKHKIQNLSTITTVDGIYIVVPLTFTTGLPALFPLNHHMEINLIIYTKDFIPVISINNPDGFEPSLSGVYTVELCVPPPSTHRIPLTQESEPLNVVTSQPNPFDNYLELHIQAEQEKTPEVQFMDVSGKQWRLPIQKKSLGNGKWIASVSTEQLPAGIYFYTVQIGDRFYSEKLIKY